MEKTPALHWICTSPRPEGMDFRVDQAWASSNVRAASYVIGWGLELVDRNTVGVLCSTILQKT